MASPLIMLMANAVLFGTLTAVTIVIAVAVDSWQSYGFDPAILSRINASSTKYTILSLSDTNVFYKVILKSEVDANSTSESHYLYTSYTGLWRLCDTLNESERAMIPEGERNTRVKQCFTFVTDYDEDAKLFSKNAMQIARLQNSAASCYIVVLIDLVTAAVVGVIGITQKQVASCMVTGVLYCMAALFSVFGLSMFHTKHSYEAWQCSSLESIPDDICPSRNVHILWAIPLAWIGMILATVASILWLLVARALRVIKAKTML